MNAACQESISDSRKLGRILIVDDDPVVHLLYRRHLTAAGFELVNAKDGIEALQIVDQVKPDLILLDVMMPAKDGLTTLRELRSHSSMRDVPVVIITANVREYEVSRSESKMGGADCLLTKPLSPTKLVSELRRFFPES